MLKRLLFRNRPPALAAALMVIFGLLTIPGLLMVLAIFYYESVESIEGALNKQVEEAQAETVRIVDDFIQPVVSTLTVMAEIAALAPEQFRDERSQSLLYKGLTAAGQIHSISITFEDGFFREFSRIGSARRQLHPEIPALANWSTSRIEPSELGSNEKQHRSFFSEWPYLIETALETVDIEPRNRPSYIGTKSSKKLFITDINANLVSGIPSIAIAMPIIKEGAYIGSVVADITVPELSKLLQRNKISANSLSMIIDGQNATIAASNLAGLTPSETTPLVAAVNEQAKLVLNNATSGTEYTHSYISSDAGIKMSVSLFRLNNEFNLDWRAIIITPTSDFIGGLYSAAKTVMLFILALILVNLLLIFKLSKRLVSGIVRVSKEISSIQTMHFDDSKSNEPSALIREIRDLQNGINLLRTALRSFSLYVPLGVVRKLVESGKALTPCVEVRPLTILFCDIENFSTMAQEVSPQELLEYTTAYFALATKAVSEQEGTVDKFIGDAVMAFWGAPAQLPEPALHACRSALRIVEQLREINLTWAAQGKRTLRVRVGINTADVLVGNIGSAERLSYTALGDGVNVASRLEGINKEFGSTICISDTVYEHVKDRVITKPLKPVSVKGRKGEFMVYELLGLVD